ncbi:MAG: GHKL domain-containing protein [Syntrophomonadaceae bacterium]|nr:GHKL domain-containing protein [Syntrophomonadaceae bacterium]
MFKDNNLLMISTILIETLFIVLMNQQIYLAHDITNLKVLLPLANVLVVFMGGLALFSIKGIERNVKKRVEVNLLKAHLQQVEGLLNSLQSQKHEHARHIQVIQAMLYLEEIDKAKEYIDGIAQAYQPSDGIIHVGHPALTALLNSKCKVAETKGIDFAFSVKCNPLNIKMHPWDLCSILGNLLDNAMEAAVQNTGNRRVALEIKYEDNQYVMYIYNNGPAITAKERKRLFEPGFTTKNSEARGYGLYLVKKLVDRYGGNIEVKSGERTSFIVHLPDQNQGRGLERVVI